VEEAMDAGWVGLGVLEKAGGCFVDTGAYFASGEKS